MQNQVRQGYSPEEMISLLEKEGYQHVRHLPNGYYVGVAKQLFTTGLFLIENEYSYKKRYCYHSYMEAMIASKYWDGEADPVGNWIVEKPGNRQGPGSPHYLKDKQEVLDKVA